MPDFIAYWYDGDDYHLTRCRMESGAIVGFPKGGEIVLLINFESGFEPIMYDNAGEEIGIDSFFPS